MWWLFQHFLFQCPFDFQAAVVGLYISPVKLGLSKRLECFESICCTNIGWCTAKNDQPPSICEALDCSWKRDTNLNQKPGKTKDLALPYNFQYMAGSPTRPSVISLKWTWMCIQEAIFSGGTLVIQPILDMGSAPLRNTQKQKCPSVPRNELLLGQTAWTLQGRTWYWSTKNGRAKREQDFHPTSGGWPTRMGL
jgi:hypothetical protein